MKIAFLSFYNGKIDRGVEVAVKALTRRLAKKYQVTVFQAGNQTIPDVDTVQLMVERDWPEDSSNDWKRAFYLDYYGRKIFSFTLKFLPFFLRNRYDVVIPMNGGWQVALCRILTWTFGKKLIVEGNAGIGRDDFWQLLWWPTCFIAISPQGFQWAKKRVPWIKSLYIPYGVDIELFKMTKPRTVTLKKPVVLCVSALLSYKRIDYLIKAMAKVREASLLVVGQGYLEKELFTLGNKLLGNRFLLKTGVKHDELIGYYKASDLFSLPSKSSEALGIVYVEAMAAGLPIVAPDDWRREIIGEAGVFVNPENSDEYAAGIKRALTTDFEDKPQKQAEKFDWSNIVRQYEELLNTFE